MKTITKWNNYVMFFMILLLLVGCASVPKEVVELSYTTGKDLESIHSSYNYLIHELYEQLRAQRISYLDEVWIPKFLSLWIKDGKLIEVAKGRLIWSEDDTAFVTPSNYRDSTKFMSTIHIWAEEAIYQIEVKRGELLEPLNKEEEALLRDVDAGFKRLIRANAAITTHLNSIREVQEIQDEILESFKIKDLRDKINSAIVDASDRAAKSLQKIKEADAKLEDIIN